MGGQKTERTFQKPGIRHLGEPVNYSHWSTHKTQRTKLCT